ncbi:hypothetical protein Dimus_015905, partial [Dionaea muscipula]
HSANRRRDEDSESETEVEKEEEVAPETEQVEEDAEVEGEPMDTEAAVEDLESRDKYFDAVDEERSVDEGVTTPTTKLAKAESEEHR